MTFQDLAPSRAASAASPDIDMAAAWMRRAQADSLAFLESFACRLEAALPDRSTVERKRVSMFSRERRVEEVSILLDSGIYSLQRVGADVEARHKRSVRNVVISSRTLPLDAWLRELGLEMAGLSKRSGASRAALSALLAS